MSFVPPALKRDRREKDAQLMTQRCKGAFFMCVSMSDKPFDAEACNIGGQASATNGLSDATNRLSDVKNAPCNRPLIVNHPQTG
jgi:hypothetical protein